MGRDRAPDERSGRSHDLSDVRALTFDIFGTTVDWRSGVAAEGGRLGRLHGIEADWERWLGDLVPLARRARDLFEIQRRGLG